MFWNVRGIANAPTQNVLKRLINLYNVAFLVIMELFVLPNPELYSRMLGLVFQRANASGKIWIFTKQGITFDVVDDSEQVIQGRISVPSLANPIMVSAIYAKCSRAERYELWDKLRLHAATTVNIPRIVGGDFNTILHLQDRVGSETNRV